MRSKKRSAALVAAIFILSTFAIPGLAAPTETVVSASSFRPESGAFTVNVALPADAAVSAVHFPAWSRPDQSDIVWHEAAPANGRWSAEIQIREHGWNVGPYVVHCYATAADGSLNLLGGTAVLTGLPKGGTLSVAASGGDAYAVLLREAGLPKDAPVSFRVLASDGSEAATRDAVPVGSMFAAQIPAASLRGPGPWTVQACFGPQKSVLAGTNLEGTLPQKPLYIDSVDGGQGTFRVVADTRAQPDVQGVRAAVWAQQDQSDLLWLPMERSGNCWVAAADVEMFGHAFGLYTVHAYAQYADGSFSLLDGITEDIEPANYLCHTENEDGTYTLRILGTQPAQAPLRTAVWSAVYGQDDLTWYEMAPRDADAWHLDVDPKDYLSGRTLKASVYSGDHLLATLSFPKAVSDVGRTSLAAQQRLQQNAEEVYAKVGTDLHEVYKYVRDSFSYVSRDGHVVPPEGYTREEWYAVEGLETFHGNCYTFASSFYELAKRLGYDVEYVEGEVPSVSGKWIGHGFVLLTVDGSTYICDPVFEHSSTTGRNYYMQPVEKPRTTYRW